MTGDTTLGPARASAGLAVEPGDLIRHFVVLGVLGRGGAGVVVSAYDPSLDRKVAIKLVRAATDDTTELLREAQALAKLSHPSVVTVYEVGTFADRVYIAMEYVRGVTLDAWLGARPRTLREIVTAFVAIGRGLEAAHAADLVHCDVKPRNVMAVDGGGFRVVDFGLALAINASERHGPSGTPAYMAPEQARNEVVDARADQYSFCVALHEAVHGAMPGPGRPRRSAPGWLTRILERGLAPERELRFPSMTALLAELAVDRRARRWRVAAALGFAGAAAAAVVPQVVGDTDPCPDPGRQVRAVWSAERATVLDAVFAAATGDSWRRARAGLERYAAELTTMRGAACRAARVDRTDTESMLDLRRTCLDERVRALGALVDVLAAPGAPSPRAAEAVAALPSAVDCADAAWLLARVKPPADPAARATVEAIRGELADAVARFTVARYADAMAIARAAYARAAELDYPAVRAEAAGALGMMLAYNGEDGVVDHLNEAVRLGLRSHNYEAVAAGWGQLIFQLGNVLGRTEEALVVADNAVALLEGMPGGDRRLAGVVGRRGFLHSRLGAFDAAEADLRRAVELRTRHQGPTHSDTAAALYYLGTVLVDRGDLEAGLETLARARDVFRDHVSATHNLGHLAVKDMAVTLRNLGRPAEALAALDSVAATLDEALGGDPFGDRARFSTERGRALTMLGRHGEALAAQRAALDVATAKLGEDSAGAVLYRARVGTALIAIGDVAAARAQLGRALELATAAGADDPGAAEPLAGLALLDERAGRWAAALERYARARVLADRGIDLGRRCAIAHGLARARQALGRPAEALPPRCTVAP